MKFRLGDPVRVINRLDIHWDAVGRVTTIDKSTDGPNDLVFRVSGLNSTTPLWYGPNELILAEKEDSR